MSNREFEALASALDALEEASEVGVKVGVVTLEHTRADVHYALFSALNDAEMNDKTGAFVGRWRNVPVCSFLTDGKVDECP